MVTSNVHDVTRFAIKEIITLHRTSGEVFFVRKIVIESDNGDSYEIYLFADTIHKLTPVIEK